MDHKIAIREEIINNHKHNNKSIGKKQKPVIRDESRWRNNNKYPEPYPHENRYHRKRLQKSKRVTKQVTQSSAKTKRSTSTDTKSKKKMNPRMDYGEPPSEQQTLADSILKKNSNGIVKEKKYRKVNRRHGFSGLTNIPVTGPFSMFADQLPLDWIRDLSVEAIVSLNQSYGAREALRPFNVTEDHLIATNMTLRRLKATPKSRRQNYERYPSDGLMNFQKMACITLVQTYYAAMVDLRGYVGKRLTYQKNLAYEVGYITHSVVYYYQCLLEFFHQAYRRFYVKQHKADAPVAYMIYIYVHIVHLSKVITHLCNMMHELPRRYRSGVGSSVFEDYHLYGKSNIKDAHLLSPEALKKIAQMNKETNLKEKYAFLEKRKQKRKQKKELQDQVVKNFDWSKINPQPRKPDKPHYWENEYGWSIEDNWSQGIPYEHKGWCPPRDKILNPIEFNYGRRSCPYIVIAQNYSTDFDESRYQWQRCRSSRAESFLSGSNANFLEAQYLDWARSKGAIDSSWDRFYDSLNSGALTIEEVEDDFSPSTVKPKDTNTKETQEQYKEKIKLHLAVQNLIRSYQVRGHLLAKTDPLSLTMPARFLVKDYNMDKKGLQCRIVARELGSVLCEKHMDMVFELPDRTFIGGTETSLTLREIINRLERSYCNTIGVEYMHLYDLDMVNFIRERMELPTAFDRSHEEKRLIMRRLTKAVFLEKYFATKWPAEKRFGLEGGESMIVLLEEIVDTSTKLGVESIVMAMQHRGRLNMLVNVCRKQLTDIFAQFKPLEPKEPGSGDIKYHLGTYIHRFIRRTNKYIKVSMSANPSHLEVVSPVVVGKARAEQFWKGDLTGDKVMAIIMHGDAAFAGQGVVYETAHLSYLPAYTTHGSIHIVCNNQIGYTTDPRFARSSPYCTDVAKCVDAPVLHANADDAEAVAHVARIAIEFRCKFKKDVVLDLVCYRRFGHSEEDEPMFTQPFMYKKIRSMTTVDQVYAAKLKAEGVVTDSDIKGWEKEYMDTLNQHFELSKKVTKLSIMDWIDTPWTGFFESKDPKKVDETGISEATINTIATHFCKPPEPWAFEVHKGILRILAGREKMVKEGMADWAMGEALAYGALLRDQIHIRFTGEDVERGTMAHRHHVYHHQGVDGATHRVMDTLYPDQAQYHLHNSSLSEFGILGFETGYSYSSPYCLVLWEAQYGDFADTAQPVFDTFIANGESKWVCQSGLVVQLPHGIDGAGPEHSSARIERYLAQCDDDEDILPNIDDKDFELNQLRAANWIVCNITTPANYFHMIRRQIALPFRKPLILMTPKVGLKHPYYRSPFKDFLLGTCFQRAIQESGPACKNPEAVKKLIFCSGKIAITIDELRKEQKLEDKIAMCRIEQVYPFPYDIIVKEAAKYKNAKIFYAQEEHKNQGPWLFAKVRLENLFQQKIGCISRPSSSASATGIKWIHAKELKELKESIIRL